jgi:hypothetical protein
MELKERIRSSSMANARTSESATAEFEFDVFI